MEKKNIFIAPKGSPLNREFFMWINSYPKRSESLLAPSKKHGVQGAYRRGLRDGDPLDSDGVGTGTFQMKHSKWTCPIQMEVKQPKRFHEWV